MSSSVALILDSDRVPPVANREQDN